MEDRPGTHRRERVRTAPSAEGDRDLVAAGVPGGHRTVRCDLVRARELSLTLLPAIRSSLTWSACARRSSLSLAPLPRFRCCAVLRRGFGHRELKLPRAFCLTPLLDLQLGRRTYEIFAAHWPSAVDDPGNQTAERGDQVRGVIEASWILMPYRAILRKKRCRAVANACLGRRFRAPTRDHDPVAPR
jgi:hypothetical protein